MRKKRTNKIYLKAFRIMNSKGELTEEDFYNFKEKFEIIRNLYRKESGRDTFINFRSITKEIKRAAHNAGLESELIKAEITSDDNYFYIQSNEPFLINLFITFRSAINFNEEDNFIITDIEGFDRSYIVISDYIYKIKIDDDVKDDKDISYKYRKREDNHERIKYIYRCINNDNNLQ